MLKQWFNLSARCPRRMRAVQAECAPSKPSARRPSRVRAVQGECAPCSDRVQLVLLQAVGIASRRSPLRRGAPLEASPQQQRRQQRCGEQWHSNGSGKGISATTAWHSLIAASSAFFLLSLYILLYRKGNRRSSHVNDTIISSNLFLSLSLCACEDFKRNGDRANFYRL